MDGAGGYIFIFVAFVEEMTFSAMRASLFLLCPVNAEEYIWKTTRKSLGFV